MKKAICVFIGIVLCACGAARGQWTIDLHETTQHLDSICGGSGHPLADGTWIRIYHDWNSNGPDDSDTLLGICDVPPNCDSGPVGTVNYNKFRLNGARHGCVGGFSTMWPPVERSVYCAFGAPVPNRIYLSVCFGDRHYSSEVIQPEGSGGYIDIEINSWTCVEGPCPGCEPPLPITDFRATPACRAVDLEWTYPESPYPADSLAIWRLIGSVPPMQSIQVACVPISVTSFHDTINDPRVFAQPYTYRMKAWYTCGGEPRYCPSWEVWASADDYAFTGAIRHVNATDSVCDSVLITWHYTMDFYHDTPDSFVVLRGRGDFTRVGAVPYHDGQFNYAFWYRPPVGPVYWYSICFWNRGCGEHGASAADPGRALDCSSAGDRMDGLLPTAFHLYPNYPNPFNSRTRIEFDLPRATSVTMNVFNISGQRAATLVSGTVAAGNHTVDFDAAAMPSGVYIIRMEAEGWMSSRKMLLLK